MIQFRAMLDRLGYATGLDPAAKNGEAGRRITFAEMYWKNCNNPKRGGADIDPAKVVGEVENVRAHPLLSPRNHAAALALRFAQDQAADGYGDLSGRGTGVFFCGNYSTPGNGHDLSLLSGFAVAHRLGAPYPRAWKVRDAAAFRDFSKLRRLLGL